MPINASMIAIIHQEDQCDAVQFDGGKVHSMPYCSKFKNGYMTAERIEGRIHRTSMESQPDV